MYEYFAQNMSGKKINGNLRVLFQYFRENKKKCACCIGDFILMK